MVCVVNTDVEDGATVTEPTGTFATMIVPVPDFPSLVAVIVVVPADTPVTTPVVEIVAIAVELELHVTERPVSVLPTASLVMAVNVCVPATITFAESGLTVTVATGTRTTFTEAVPVFPSHVAVIVAVPSPTPCTTPDGVTVAMDVLLELHVTVRLRTAPFASFTVATSVVLLPTTTVVFPVTVTVLTGAGVTDTVAVALFVSLVAVIVAEPTATPVTTPDDETVATELLLDVQVTSRSVTIVPFVSLTVTVNVPVVVAGTVMLDGESATLPTGTVLTVIDAVPDLPSLVAVMVALPAATAVTVPVDDTVATLALLVVHVTVRPVMMAPL